MDRSLKELNDLLDKCIRRVTIIKLFIVCLGMFSFIALMFTFLCLYMLDGVDIGIIGVYLMGLMVGSISGIISTGLFYVIYYD